MALELEILSPGDKPVLIGLNAPDYTEYARSVLEQLGYRPHATSDPEEFLQRFGYFQYHLVLVEENLGTTGQDTALTALKQMPMSARRHATIFLVSDVFSTLDRLRAFQHSVHAVINRTDFDKLMPVVQQVMNDNANFHQVYRDVQSSITQGRR